MKTAEEILQEGIKDYNQTASQINMMKFNSSEIKWFTSLMESYASQFKQSHPAPSDWVEQLIEAVRQVAVVDEDDLDRIIHLSFNDLKSALASVSLPGVEKQNIVYIAHPVSGDVKGNIDRILKIVREINLSEPDVVPLVPYLADLMALDDNIPEERQRGIKNDVAVLKSGMVTELRLYGDRISAGMQHELDLAIELGILVKNCIV